MANQNLSQFGEKLFVADADHTFIWDTAASISKRVSRNSWLNSGTLTSDAPVTISQTWNNAAVAFTGLKVNAVSTASAATSLLLDLQVGGVSKLKVDKDGIIVIGSGAIRDWGSGQLGIGGAGAAFLYASSNFIQSVSQFALGPSFGSPTVFITRDADNTLALRNGAAAQTFNVYGTYTSITDYKRLSLSCSATTGNATIGVPFNSVLAVTGGSSPSTTATITFATQAAAFPVGSSVVIAGVTPSGYNGTYVVTASTTSSVSYTVGGALAAWSSGGTATVSGSAALTLTGAGNLGIGTTAPATTLEVNGSLRITGVGQFGPTSTYYGLALFRVGTSTMAAQIYGDVNGLQFTSNGGADTVRILNSGNVGIGTTAPASALHISGALGSNTTTYDSAAALKLTNTTGNSSWLLTSGVIGVVNASFSIRQESSSLPALVISNLGNVGIGTTSPSSKLHVAGDVTLPNGGSIFFGGGFNIYGTTTSTTINGPTAFGILNVASNGVTKWTFNYDGLLCGGGTTASFPALKRSSTTMQARLADDTAFAPIQGKLTTDTAFTATTVTPTGFITLYDSTGTAYKVPCVPA